MLIIIVQYQYTPAIFINVPIFPINIAIRGVDHRRSPFRHIRLAVIVAETTSAVSPRTTCAMEMDLVPDDRPNAQGAVPHIDPN
jgi:hypothetical protein